MTGETTVQFHNDQIHLLVSHESQISVYDSKLECVRSWSPKEALCAPISSAIYSCDGTLVYAGFGDGAVGVFDADSLRLRCRIAPSSYIPPSTSSGKMPFDMVLIDKDGWNKEKSPALHCILKELRLSGNEKLSKTHLKIFLLATSSSTETAEFGKAALAKLRPPHNFDACFMDLQMPEMDG